MWRYQIFYECGIYFINQNTKLKTALAEAEKAKQTAEIALKKVEDAQAAKTLTEFETILDKMKIILKGGNCPPKEYIEPMKDMQEKYPEKKDLQAQVEQIIENHQ